MTRSGLAFLVALFVWGAGIAHAAGAEQDLKAANELVQRSIGAARGGDLTAARQAYDEYENTWFEIEDGVRAVSRTSYVAIERQMTTVSNAFAATPPDAAAVVKALGDLDREQQTFISGQPPAAGTSAPPPAASTNITTLLDQLSDAQAALGRNDYTTAAARLKSFESTWLEVEGQVKTRSADDYRQTENDMALATTLASQSSPQATAVVNRMATRLEPYREAQRYGVFDATIILLREGLEALLVVVALSAFLKKSSNRAGQPWLWGGAAGGLLLSVVLGFTIQAFFGAIITPANRELMEGAIGLVAAAMLIYVSYWLHSKASLEGWQKYIKAQTTQAVAGGRLIGLAVLAFLAVFREGAETALFYLGMASNISSADLLLGLGLGFGGLAVLGFLMVVVGLRIPMRPFFTVASVLVFYLCFKFVGTGVHALQIAGVIPSGSAAYLPTLDAIGLYPTWPTTIAQLVLLAAAVWVVLRDRIVSGARASVAASAAVMLILGGCGPAAPATTSTPSGSAPQSVLLPPAPTLTSDRTEAKLVAAPRHRLEELAAALQKNDIPAARASLEAFNADWNGMEVYVNVRSRALYGEIETHYEADITQALEQPKPDATQILPLVQAMVAQYDEAIKLSDTGPALSPLFDDLAVVRTARAPLRTVSPALKASNTARAVSEFKEFKTRLPQAQLLIAARSADADQEIKAALDAADKALTASAVNASEAAPLVDRLLERYNFGVNLLNAAARNADLNKATFSTEDVQNASALTAIQKDLRSSASLWDSGNGSGATEAARLAAGAKFEAIAPALQARGGADAAVKKALDTYVQLTSVQPGDAGKIHAANKAAIEAVAIGQQALVGQFWTDSGFSRALQVAIGMP